MDSILFSFFFPLEVSLCFCRLDSVFSLALFLLAFFLSFPLRLLLWDWTCVSRCLSALEL